MLVARSWLTTRYTSKDRAAVATCDTTLDAITAIPAQGTWGAGVGD
jgi:hypothetical protein